MSLYTERWTARPAWLALSIPERIAYLDQLKEGIQALTAAGARLVGLVLNEVPHVSCQYVAVWAMPDGETLGRRLEEVLEEAGWHHYFQRAAASGLPTSEHLTFAPPRTAANGHG